MNELEIVGILAGCLVASGILLLLIAVHLKVRIEKRQRARRMEESRELAVQADLGDLVGRLNEVSDGIEQRVKSRVEELRELLSQADAAISRLGREGPDLQTGQSDRTDEQPQTDTPAQEIPDSDRVAASYREIFHLKAQGLDPIEIARRVQMNVGEVELVLNLYPSTYGAEES